MTPENLKESWLNRETQFSAFTNGPLLDFWQHREESQFVGVDDIPIHYVRFIHPKHHKAIVISPGRSESYVKYPEVAYDFYHLGYDVFIIDHRGQGRSGRILKKAMLKNSLITLTILKSSLSLRLNIGIIQNVMH